MNIKFFTPFRCCRRFKVRRRHRLRCLLYFLKLGLILFVILVTDQIINTDTDRSKGKLDESLDFIDTDSSYNDGEPFPQLNFLVAIEPIISKYEALLRSRPLLVLDQNPERITNFINKRYSELMNYSSLVKGKSSDEGTFDQILNIPKLYNNSETSYNLWRPRKLSHNGKYVIDKDDRTLAQLVLTMEDLSRTKLDKFEKKTILLASSLSSWYIRSPDQFLEGCPQLSNKCEFTTNFRNKSENISAIIYSDGGPSPASITNSSFAQADNILRFYFVLESNYVSDVRLERQTDILTSYWRGSGLVTPYGKWAYFDPSVQQKEQEKNYAEGKTKLVAAFVTNCSPRNARQVYIGLLLQHIQVDVYGTCGSLECPRQTEEKCFKKLKKYKFYLSFENANCRDYITEKFWLNALRHDVVPVVMGAHPDDYEAVAPKRSYIHVEDFNSTKQLAEYLTYLNEHDEDYNKYFKWKGTGTFVNCQYFCRVCAMLHYAQLNPPPNTTRPFSWVHGGRESLCLPYWQTYWTNSSLKLE